MKTYRKLDTELIKEDLINGEIIAFGTDTVFGLACVYDDLNAIKKIYDAKGRDLKKALPMMCGNKKMIEEVAYVNDNAKKLMDKYMPGAITIIYKKKDVIDDYVTSGLKTIGIRIPDDDWVINLINMVGKPLLVTSANLSNEPSLIKWEEVKDKLEGKIDGIVMEDAKGQIASTIVDCSEGNIKVLREGPISLNDIMNV